MSVVRLGFCRVHFIHYGLKKVECICLLTHRKNPKNLSCAISLQLLKA